MAGTKTWKTPGVYVSESGAVPPTIRGVATAVPIFIGHTAAGPALAPTPIGSLAGYEAQFGGGADGFCLHDSIALFFANGGGDAVVVSAGFYGGGVDAAKLMAGLNAAADVKGVTLLAIPDAVLLPPDPGPPGIPKSAAFGALAQAMLLQCGRLMDRVALLDVYGAGSIDTGTPAAAQAGIDACVANFRAAVGSANLGYGAAYFPFLSVGVAKRTALPPSGAIAGLYCANDATRGVWHAPANVPVAGIADLSLHLTDTQQAPLNAPPNGKAVNALRSIAGRGLVVWGARTLDGNNLDYRYIQVRRTLVYIEQSIKTALQPFVFAANDGNTWAMVTTMINRFLADIWRQGGLMGAKPQDAFFVQCGLGSTMTAQDILDGRLIVRIGMALMQPAEFAVLSITQNNQGA